MSSSGRRPRGQFAASARAGSRLDRATAGKAPAGGCPGRRRPLCGRPARRAEPTISAASSTGAGRQPIRMSLLATHHKVHRGRAKLAGLDRGRQCQPNTPCARPDASYPARGWIRSSYDSGRTMVARVIRASAGRHGASGRHSRGGASAIINQVLPVRHLGAGCGFYFSGSASGPPGGPLVKLLRRTPPRSEHQRTGTVRRRACRRARAEGA